MFRSYSISENGAENRVLRAGLPTSLGMIYSIAVSFTGRGLVFQWFLNGEKASEVHFHFSSSLSFILFIYNLSFHFSYRRLFLQLSEFISTHSPLNGICPAVEIRGKSIVFTNAGQVPFR